MEPEHKISFEASIGEESPHPQSIRLDPEES